MGLIDRIKNVTGGSSAGYGDDFDDTYYDNFDEYGEGADDEQGGMGGMNAKLSPSAILLTVAQWSSTSIAIPSCRTIMEVCLITW